MDEDEPKKSWWHTLPGILTSVTATITALGGLVVAINQTNWFSGKDSDAGRAETGVESDAAAVDAGAVDERSPDVDASPATGATDGPPREPAAAVGTAPAGGAAGVTLPAMRSYTLGDAQFTLLGGSLAPRNPESSTLTLQVRLLNNGPYPVNFWDSQFRLLVDGVPRAPNSGLNTLVQGRAAEDGEIRFVVPRSATDTRLRILLGEESTDVPLTLVHGT